MQGRIRSIKPDFFQHEGLSALAHGDRLLFAGLWCYADRAGRLPDDPTLLKALIFPRERYDVNAALTRLAPHVVRYEVEGKRYLWIRGFTEHQRPGNREPESAIPPCPAPLEHAQAPHKHAEGEWEGNGKGRERECRAALDGERASRFARFYDPYPRHEAKAEALRAFTKLAPDDVLLERIVRDVTGRAWPEDRKYVPLPATYLNGRRWEDDAAARGDPRMERAREEQRRAEAYARKRAAEGWA